MTAPAVPAGYDPSNVLPFVGLAIRLGAGARSVVTERPILIIGNKIATDITRSVGANSYTTTAGTLAAATPTFIASDEEADAAAGAGSEVALAYQILGKQITGKGAYFCLVAENGGAVKATALCLFAGTITASGTVTLTVAGRSVQVSLTTSDTGTTTAAAVANLVNQKTRWPVTATVSTGTMTLTAKNGGTRGNNIPFMVEITATGLTAALNGGTAGIAPSALLGVSTGTPGSGADDVTAALAAIAPNTYHIVGGYDDATNLALIKAHLGTYAGIQNRRRQQATMAVTNATLAAAITLAQGVNGQRVQMAYHRTKSSGGRVDPMIRSTGETAAGVAALRLYGDGSVGNGGTVRGEIAYAAANLNNGQIGGIPAQDEGIGARMLDSEMQQALFGGLTPLRPSSANPGLTQISRSFTSYSIDVNGNPTTAVQLTSDVTVIDVMAARIEQRINTEFPNKNLAPEPAVPVAPVHPDVIYPSMVRAAIVKELLKAQNVDGLLVKSEINADAIALDISPDDASLILAEIPASAIKPFNAFAGTLSEVTNNG